MKPLNKQAVLNKPCLTVILFLQPFTEETFLNVLHTISGSGNQTVLAIFAEIYSITRRPFLSLFFFLVFFFNVDRFFGKSLLHSYNTASVLCFGVFGHKACETSPQPGIEPVPPPLEGEVLTTGPARTSHRQTFSFCALSSHHLLGGRDTVNSQILLK